jgi:hypothetical protein
MAWYKKNHLRAHSGHIKKGGGQEKTKRWVGQMKNIGVLILWELSKIDTEFQMFFFDFFIFFKTICHHQAI